MCIRDRICTAAMKEGYTVTFAPSYGQEKRGGRTMCQMVVSEEKMCIRDRGEYDNNQTLLKWEWKYLL